MSFLRCDGELSIDPVLNTFECSNWSIVADSQMVTSDFLALLVTELQALNDFDVTSTSSLIVYFCVLIITGYTAGTVLRLMKKT